MQNLANPSVMLLFLGLGVMAVMWCLYKAIFR